MSTYKIYEDWGKAIKRVRIDTDLSFLSPTNAGANTGKFLVFDSGNSVKYRTAAEVAAEIGVPANTSYIQNQISAAQPASFWVDGPAKIEGVTTLGKDTNTNIKTLIIKGAGDLAQFGTLNFNTSAIYTTNTNLNITNYGIGGLTLVSESKITLSGSNVTVGSTTPLGWMGLSAAYNFQVVGTNADQAYQIGMHIQNRAATGNAGITFGVGTTDGVRSWIYANADNQRFNIVGDTYLRLAPAWSGTIEFYSPYLGAVLGTFDGTYGIFKANYGITSPNSLYSASERFGYSADATFGGGTAIGSYASASTNYGAVAVGSQSVSQGGVAIGYAAQAFGSHGHAFGRGALAQNLAIAIGSSANASGIGSIAIGQESVSSVNYQVVFGGGPYSYTLKITDIPNETTDPDKILVSSSGVVKYMTKAQLGIGAGTISQPANQIIYGTGASVSSNSDLTFFPTNIPAGFSSYMGIGSYSTLSESYSSLSTVVARGMKPNTTSSQYQLISGAVPAAFIEVGSGGIGFGVNKTAANIFLSQSDMRLTQGGNLLLGTTDTALIGKNVIFASGGGFYAGYTANLALLGQSPAMQIYSTWYGSGWQFGVSTSTSLSLVPISSQTTSVGSQILFKNDSSIVLGFMLIIGPEYISSTSALRLWHDGQSGSSYIESRIDGTTKYPLLINSSGQVTAVGGHLLIGTSTDGSYNLDVNGTSRFNNVMLIDNSYIKIQRAGSLIWLYDTAGWSADAKGWFVGTSSFGSGAGFAISKATDGGSVSSNPFVIHRSDNIGIGTTTDAGYRLDVAGGLVRFTAAYSSASDAAVKFHIRNTRFDRSGGPILRVEELGTVDYGYNIESLGTIASGTYYSASGIYSKVGKTVINADAGNPTTLVAYHAEIAGFNSASTVDSHYAYRANFTNTLAPNLYALYANAGNIYLATMQNETSDPNKIVVWSNGFLKYMTKAQLSLSTASAGLNQVVIGTGSGITSGSNLTWNGATLSASSTGTVPAQFSSSDSSSYSLVRVSNNGGYYADFGVYSGTAIARFGGYQYLSVDAYGQSTMYSSVTQGGNSYNMNVLTLSGTLNANGWTRGTMTALSVPMNDANNVDRIIYAYNSASNSVYALTSQGQHLYQNNFSVSAFNFIGAMYATVPVINIVPATAYPNGPLVKVDLTTKHQSYFGYGYETVATYSAGNPDTVGVRGFSTTIVGGNGPTYGFYADVTKYSGATGNPYAFFASNGISIFQDTYVNNLLQVYKAVVGINDIAQFVTTSGGAISFGGSASANFVPTIKMQSDFGAYNQGYILSTTNDVGSLPVLMIDSRLSSGPLANQKVLSIGSYGNSYFEVRATGTLWSNTLNDGTGVAKMVTVTNGVLSYQTIPSVGAGITSNQIAYGTGTGITSSANLTFNGTVFTAITDMDGSYNSNFNIKGIAAAAYGAAFSLDGTPAGGHKYTWYASKLGTLALRDVTASSFLFTSNSSGQLIFERANNWDLATPGLTNGSVIIGSDIGSADYGGAITFSVNGLTTAQAGVYVKGSGAYGTKMLFATTDNFSIGSKTRMLIDHQGVVTINNLSDGTGVARMVIVTNGTLSYQSIPTGSGTYTLPIASASVLGGIKVGTGLSIDGTGILSVSAVTAAYTAFTDGTNTASTTNAATFKFRSANNLLSLVVADNDATHGDNLLLTVNSSNITTLGTITSGTWNGTAIADTYISSAATWNAKQAALSGTGFVKISGTTISYDNSTYLTANQTITLSGDVSGSGTTAITTTIGANKVTLAMMAQVATATFLGRTTAGPGNVEALTVTQATAMLNVFNTTLKGLVPASGGGTVNFLRADGSWATPPTGGGALAINNNADNRILTANGGTTSIEAEAGLTYDPSANELSFPYLTDYKSAVVFGSYSSIGALSSGAGFMMGTGVKPAVTGNSVIKINPNGSYSHWITMRYDRGISFITGNDGALNTVLGDTVGERMRIDASGNFYLYPFNDSTGVARVVTVTNGLLGYASFVPSALTQNQIAFGSASNIATSSSNLTWDGSTLNVNGNINGVTLGVANTSQTSGRGISLYGGATGAQPTYGIMFSGTPTYGTHGDVSADWATYFLMNTTANRGWIFKAADSATSSGNVASISNLGYMTLNSGMTLGGDLYMSYGSPWIKMVRPSTSAGMGLLFTTTTGSTNWWFYQNSGTTDLQIQSSTETTGAPRMRFTMGSPGNIVMGENGGRVGVGVATSTVQQISNGVNYTYQTGESKLIVYNTADSAVSNSLILNKTSQSVTGYAHGILFADGNSFQAAIRAKRRNSASDYYSDLRFYTNPSVSTGFTDETYLRMVINGDGTITIPNLAGTGTRMMVADASGNVSTQTIPSGGGSALAINNNANNRMLTANGGTTSIDAEPNWSFDGSWELKGGSTTGVTENHYGNKILLDTSSAKGIVFQSQSMTMMSGTTAVSNGSTVVMFSEADLLTTLGGNTRNGYIIEYLIRITATGSGKRVGIVKSVVDSASISFDDDYVSVGANSSALDNCTVSCITTSGFQFRVANASGYAVEVIWTVRALGYVLG